MREQGNLRHFYPAKAKAAAMAATFASLVLTSCSPEVASDEVADGSNTYTSEHAPTFTGPFASEFTQTWERYDDSFIRGVIGDQTITDQEWAETVTRLGRCLEGHGMKMTEYNHEDGSYAFGLGTVDAETGNRLATECEESSGVSAIGRLRISLHINPANREMDELIHECLVRVEAVPASYTIEDYRRDNPTFAFPFATDEDRRLYDDCVSAPLTAQRGE